MVPEETHVYVIPNSKISLPFMETMKALNNHGIYIIFCVGKDAEVIMARGQEIYQFLEENDEHLIKANVESPRLVVNVFQFFGFL